MNFGGTKLQKMTDHNRILFGQVRILNFGLSILTKIKPVKIYEDFNTSQIYVLERARVRAKIRAYIRAQIRVRW